MKRILLTGGSGFIGRNLRESALRERYEIVAPSHKELDLADTDATDAYFRHQDFDIILHTAVKPGHRNAPDHSALLQTNLQLFFNLERQRGHYGRLINFGSGAVYDVARNNSGVTEAELYRNMGKDEHSFCKYIVSRHIQTTTDCWDLNIFGIFGKYEDYAIRFISNAVCKALLGMPITLRQNRRFSYLDVDDLPAILEFFIEGQPEHRSYNIVPDSPVELRQIGEAIQKTVCPGSPLHVAQEGYGLDYYGSNARLRQEMQNLRFTPIAESIFKLADYYRSILPQLDKTVFLTDK